MLVRRLTAHTLDWLLVLAITWPVTQLELRAVLVVGVATALETVLVRGHGRTLGRVALGLKVVGPAAGMTARLAFRRAAVTTLVPGAGVALLVSGALWPALAGLVLLAGTVWSAADRRGTRTWHDRVSRTAVARESVLQRR